MRILRKTGFGFLVGCWAGVGYPWAQEIHHSPVGTLAGIAGAFRMVNWPLAWFYIIFCTLAGVVFGCLPKGEPSKGVQLFYTADALWDLLTCWW